MRAAATKVIVRKGRLKEMTAGGLALPTNLKDYINVGLVLDVGSKVAAFDIDGEVVMFMAYQQSNAFEDLQTRDNLVVIDEVSVMATFTREEAEARFNVTFDVPEAVAVNGTA